jgi:hypothetical protein
MSITGTSGAVSAAAPGSAVPADVQNTMLRKALDQDASMAAQLIASVPPPQALATQGSIGTRVNTQA